MLQTKPDTIRVILTLTSAEMRRGKSSSVRPGRISYVIDQTVFADSCVSG
jgi:hypothetical protein